MDKLKIDFIEHFRNHPLLRLFVPSRDVLTFIACQFALESDFGTSHRAVAYNNYSGMKKPFKRYYYGVVNGYENDVFAVYDTFDDCILDYISWLLYNRPYQNTFDNVDNFIIFLRNSGYCPEKDYISKIQSIYSQFKNL